MIKNIFKRKRNKKGTLAGLLIVVITIPLFLFIFVFQAQGAVRTWDGGGSDGTCGGVGGDGNKWSCALNWSTDTLPGASDVATFDGTCPGHLTPVRLGSGARLKSDVRLR